MATCIRKSDRLQLIERDHGPFPQAYARLKEQGHTDEQIAARLGVTTTTLDTYKKQHGIQLRNVRVLVAETE